MSRHKAGIRISWFSVIGEILVTFGFILLFFVVWQLFINDPVVAQKQQSQAEHYRSEPSKPKKLEFAKISAKLEQGKVFGKLYVPRFESKYARLLGQGTLQAITLNKIGPGHYVSSQWPGQVGNFAIAGHRNSHGGPFNKIDELTTGDKVFVETNKSWFTYEYRQTKIVDRSDIGVISKVPVGMDRAQNGGRYMTMTSCHPKWNNSVLRIIVWLELVDKQPHDAGMPLALRKAQEVE